MNAGSTVSLGMWAGGRCLFCSIHIAVVTAIYGDCEEQVCENFYLPNAGK
jgi:hypothetical protein